MVCVMGLKMSKFVNVVRDKDGNVFLHAPKGFMLTLQTDDWMLYRVTPKKIFEQNTTEC